MSDLAQRLRTKADMIHMGERIAWGSETALMRQAADVIQQQREVMRMAEKVILSATAFASQADILEAKECISALDAALKGS